MADLSVAATAALYRSTHREQWLSALSVFRKRAAPGEELPPPDDDVTMVGFADDLMWQSANMVGGPAIQLYPMHLGKRVQLKRVWKKVADDGKENPNYGRFYCVAGDGARYFQWLTDTLWWKSYAMRDCLCDELVQWLGCLSWSTMSKRELMYCSAFHRLYRTELPVANCARGQIPASVADEPHTPLAQVRAVVGGRLA